jgi:hypothetical protein
MQYKRALCAVLFRSFPVTGKNAANAAVFRLQHMPAVQKNLKNLEAASARAGAAKTYATKSFPEKQTLPRSRYIW